MIDKNEIDRVRWIHGHLDHWAATLQPHQTHFWCQPLRGPRVEFTAEEVRSWPEVKSRMVHRLEDDPRLALVVGSFLGVGNGLNADELVRHHAGTRFYGCEGIDRGICLYREMLGSAEPAPVWAPSVGERVRLKRNDGKWKAGDVGVVKSLSSASNGHPERFANCGDGLSQHYFSYLEPVTSAPSVPNPERTGPFGGNDLGHEAVVAALTQALPGNVEARKRMVAALSHEHEKASDMTGLLHPLAHWSGRNPGRRKR